MLYLRPFIFLRSTFSKIRILFSNGLSFLCTFHYHIPFKFRNDRKYLNEDFIESAGSIDTIGANQEINMVHFQEIHQTD